VDARDLAAAVTQIGADGIRESGATVLAEALRGEAGAFFQQTTPGQGTPIVRGLKGSQVLHLVDGMRLNNAFFRDAPNQYLALVDPFLVDRIEVLRGAAGSLYGADALGGVVALGSRENRFDGETTRYTAGFHGRYDSADHGLIAHAEAAVGNRRGSLAGGLTWQERRDRRTGSGETARPSGFESRAGNLKLLLPDPWGGEWMLQAQTLEQPSTPRVDELVPGFGQDEPAAGTWLYEPNRRTFLHARYRGDAGPEFLDSWEVNLARQVIVDDRRTRDRGSAIENRERNESTLDGLTGQLRALLGDRLDLVLGAEFYRDEVRSSRRLVDIDTGNAETVRGRFPDRASQDSDAVYAQLNWTGPGWPEPGALALEGGLRYSRFELLLPAEAAQPSVRLTPDDATGDLRLRLALARNLQMLANVGRGFRPPNVFDLGALGPRPGNRFNVANPLLEPETVWSYDLGLRAWGDRWQVEGFLFHLDYRDRIASVPTEEITESGRIVVRSENRAEASVSGLELAATWSLTDSLDLDAVLNVTEGTERVAGLPETPADRIPPLNGRLGMRWAVSPRWGLEAWAGFAGEQDRLSPRDRLDPRIDPKGTPGWITLNARTRWQVNEALALGLQLTNLLDEAYREHGSGIDAAGFGMGAWIDVFY
jgi:outer membrane receptor protein involved in Fe transport